MNNYNVQTFSVRQSCHLPPPNWVCDSKEGEEEIKADIKYSQSSRGWQNQTRQRPRHVCSLAQK